MSRDIPIEKIRSNTEFKLRFTSPSIEELASSFRTDGHQSRIYLGFSNAVSLLPLLLLRIFGGDNI